jgi:outer membrane immunogenic protein
MDAELTMARIVLAAALATMAAATSAAQAADIPRGSSPYYSAPAPLSYYSWAGPYLGVNFGYHWGDVTNNPARPKGIAGGVQGGINWQVGQFVLGGETDLQLSSADDTFAPWKFSNPWFGTLRGRAGIAANNFLFYGTAGLAYGGGTAEVVGSLSESRTHLGWAGGFGMEVGITPNWTAKAEYLFVGLGDRSYSLTGTTNGFDTNLVRLGVNYRF